MVAGGRGSVCLRAGSEFMSVCLEGIVSDEMPEGPWAPGYIYGRGANEVVDNNVPEADGV